MMKPIPLDVNNLILNTIIFISTLTIATLAFGAELSDVEGLTWFKSRSFRIVVLIICSFIIFWTTYIKDENNEVKTFNEGYIRDSINQKKFNESLVKASSATALASSETMAKYFLKYKVAQRKIEELVKDSSKKITITNEKRPELDIGDITGRLTKDSLTISAAISASQAPVYYANIRTIYVVRKNISSFNNENLQLISNTEPIKLHYKLIPRVDGTANINNANVFSVTTPYIGKVYIYLYFRGSFEDEKGRKFILEDMYAYDFDKQTYRYLNDKEYNWIYDFIKKGIK